jgi:hypothetical protein
MDSHKWGWNSLVPNLWNEELETPLLYTLVVSGLNLDSVTDCSDSGIFVVFLRRQMAGYYLKLNAMQQVFLTTP